MSSDVNIMFKEESEGHTEAESNSGSVSTERGSPSLVGRGIANPQEFPSCNEFETFLKVHKKEEY
jgi:hypothetical protein